MCQDLRISGLRNAESYLPHIDGLRAFAVLSVFVFHLNPRWLPGGYLGVDVFFVISGYLITRLLIQDFEAGQASYLKFYERRIAQIFPALFAVVLITLAVEPVLRALPLIGTVDT